MGILQEEGTANPSVTSGPCRSFQLSVLYCFSFFDLFVFLRVSGLSIRDFPLRFSLMGIYIRNNN